MNINAAATKRKSSIGASNNVLLKSIRATKALPKRTATQSKQEAVLIMLRRKEGATTQALMRATGWQPHSVRGFLAGVVRKKLQLKLIAEMTDGKRVYRISEPKQSPKGQRSSAK